MTDYFVDAANGDDANDGLTFANAKLTLNGAEDVPVAGGDTVYVTPGIYRELLTLDVSGTAGNLIVYIGDVTGENTDGIGGVIRVTGSDNDQTATRANCINLNERGFRTFRGFSFDFCTSYLLTSAGATAVTDLIIEDCYFGENVEYCINLGAAVASSDNIIRRSIFFSSAARLIQISNGSTIDDTGDLIENCILIGNHQSNDYAIAIQRVGGITVKNCYMSAPHGIRVLTALAGGQTITVNNSILYGCSTALRATVTGEITEDFNTFYGNTTDRTNTNTGASSVTHPPLLEGPILLDGHRFPWFFGNLSPNSQVAAIAGSSESTDDVFGFTRPTTSAKKSWGAIQRTDMERETGTVRTGTASIVLHDAGRHQIFVPVTNESTTFSVYVRREIDYDGTLPQMVIKQPGQADDTTTDVGATDTWNELTTTLTPASTTDFVIVELVSNNTASAALYAESVEVFFDDLTVS